MSLKLFIFKLFFFIFIAQFSLSQICGKDKPTEPSHCLDDNTSPSDYNCCYAKVADFNITSARIVSNSSVCVLMNQNHTYLSPYLTQMNLGIHGKSLNIKLDCGEFTTEKALKKF